MNGRADKLFIAGVGVGGHLAMLSAFHSQHVLGGCFCLDVGAPDSIIQGIRGQEGAALYPQYEAKKNMIIGISKFKANISADQETQIKSDA